jgi:hypothetical protein
MTTTVLYAGNVNTTNVVCIFSNPTGLSGNNAPLFNPTQNLDRLYFDSRFEYLNIVYNGTFTTVYNAVDTNSSDPTILVKGENYKTTVIHNFGYTPAAILLDFDTKEIIGAQNFIQSVNSSFRVASLQMDSNNFYIKERYHVVNDPLPSVTRRYIILAFKHPATVPSF